MKNVVSLLSLIYNSCIFIKVWENSSKKFWWYSEKKVKMYQAAKKYFEALKSASSDKDLEVLKEKLDVLQGI